MKKPSKVTTITGTIFLSIFLIAFLLVKPLFKKLNQVVDVKIMNIDEENKKLELSIKEAHVDDWKNEIANVEGVTLELKD